MATRVELPAKREFQADSGEAAAAAAASKKAKTTDESCPNDEAMADGSSEQEEAIPEDDDTSTDEKEWEKEALEREALYRKFASMSNQDLLPDIDLTREYQLFLQLEGNADRASKITCEKDAQELLSRDEMETFWTMYRKKPWHIRRQTPDKLPDYQRLAIYSSTSESDPFYPKYFRNYYFDHGFDALYLKIADALRKCETIQWDTSYSDAYRIAEAIWKEHLPLESYLHEELLEEFVETAQERSSSRQVMKELVPLFVSLCQRGVETKEDFVGAIKEIIIEEKVKDCFPFCNGVVKEALESREGLASCRLWYRYDFMRLSLGNVQIRQAALSESKLKDLLTNYFKGDPKDVSGPDYFDYVKKKIKIAEELGILPSQ